MRTGGTRRYKRTLLGLEDDGQGAPKRLHTRWSAIAPEGKASGGSSWFVSGFGRSYFDGQDAFNVEIPAAKSVEVEQETPKATGHRLGPVGRRWRIGQDPRMD